MRKTVLLPGFCLLLCTSVCGIQERDDNRYPTEPVGIYANYEDYSFYPDWGYNRQALTDLAEDMILKVEVLKTLVDEFAEAVRAMASEMAPDLRRRIKFGKLGHILKPIKALASALKPHKPQPPDISLDLGAQIVVPPAADSMEQEEYTD